MGWKQEIRIPVTRLSCQAAFQACYIPRKAHIKTCVRTPKKVMMSLLFFGGCKARRDSDWKHRHHSVVLVHDKCWEERSQLLSETPRLIFGSDAQHITNHEPFGPLCLPGIYSTPAPGKEKLVVYIKRTAGYYWLAQPLNSRRS